MDFGWDGDSVFGRFNRNGVAKIVHLSLDFDVLLQVLFLKIKRQFREGDPDCIHTLVIKVLEHYNNSSISTLIDEENIEFVFLKLKL